MSRPSATSPGGAAKARWRSSRAVRTAGQAATREAPCPAASVRIARGDVPPVEQHLLARRRGPTPKATCMPAASRAWPCDVVRASSPRSQPAQAPPAGTARRCRAGASRACCATARLMVPLPEPLGPSMVTTGTAACTAHAARSSERKPAARASLEEPREGGRDIGHVQRSRSAPRAPQARDGKGHGDAVIAVAVDGAAAEARRRRGSRGHRAAARSRPRARSGPAAMTASRSLSLTRSSSAPRTSVSPSAHGRGDEEHRKLVDRQRHQRLGHLDAAQRGSCAPRCRRSARRRAVARCRARMHADVGAHQPQQLEQPGARRIDADVAQQQAALGRQAAGHQEECRGGEIRRHRDRRAARARWPPSSATVAPSRSTSTPKARQHPLGVIARGRRLGDAGAAAALQARQQQGRFHLRAGDRQGVVDGAQRADRRGSAPAAGPRACRCRAPISRSGTATRSIGRRMSEASPISVESKACPASSPMNRRMAVPALPMSSGAAAAAQALAGRRRARARVVLAAARCARPAPAARAASPGNPRSARKPVICGLALGDAAEHQRAVRDRFVAGHRELAGDRRPARPDSAPVLEPSCAITLQHRARIGAEHAKQRGALLERPRAPAPRAAPRRGPRCR